MMAGDEVQTEAVRTRLALARDLAALCPRELGCEIAVTGSVARGVADAHSDIELNLWANALPRPEQWGAWLVRAGATNIDPLWNDLDSTGFRWTVCRVQGVWIEIGWAETTWFDAFVRDLAAGAFVDHDRLKMGWTVERALALRTEGHLARWQAALSRYPEGLAERVIANQTLVWSAPHVPGVRWALAARRERMGLALRLTWDMQNLLRVLFALNRTWDRDLKWTDSRSLDLPLQPAALSTRIDAMFTLGDLEGCVEINQRLIVETLELAKDGGFAVQAALQSIREGLRAGLQAAGRP